MSMCDIYIHKCNHKPCSTTIEMHLEDFATKRAEVEVFCDLHIPKRRKDGVLWMTKGSNDHTRIFVRCLTNNAKKHHEHNTYNGECYPIEIFGKEEGKNGN